MEKEGEKEKTKRREEGEDEGGRATNEREMGVYKSKGEEGRGKKKETYKTRKGCNILEKFIHALDTRDRGRSLSLRRSQSPSASRGERRMHFVHDDP